MSPTQVPSAELIARIAQEAADRAAQEASEKVFVQMFLMLGMDVSKPDGILKAQARFDFLQEMHDKKQSAESIVRKTVFGSIATGLLTLIYYGFSTLFSK